MPANYTYRKTTETLVMERTNIIKQANTIAEAEVKIGAGCIEEVIVQVLFRLKFFRMYISSTVLWEDFTKVISILY
jgi:hypothetical protein